jgi:hypothetical protein
MTMTSENKRKHFLLELWDSKFVSGLSRFIMAWLAWDLGQARSNWVLKIIAILLVMVGFRIWLRAFHSWRNGFKQISNREFA